MYKIGKYEYKLSASHLLGEGTFAKVYLGIYTGLTNNIIKRNTKVAIKIIDTSKMNEKNISILEEEIRIMLMIKFDQHDNIVKCFDVFKQDKLVFIIMEYCENGDMRNILIGRSLKEQWSKYYFAQLVNALHYLHSKNIIHRDIKPRNILLTHNKKVLKLADFGFAKQMKSKSTSLLYDTVCGSPLYMAPEIMSNSYNNQTDLWSVGLILYELLYGKHPFEHCKNLPELRYTMEETSIPIPPESNNNIEVSVECLDILSKQLQKNVAQRLTWTDFFNHPWMAINIVNPSSPKLISSTSLSEQNIPKYLSVRSLSIDSINKHIIQNYLESSISNPVDDTPQSDDDIFIMDFIT